MKRSGVKLSIVLLCIFHLVFAESFSLTDDLSLTELRINEFMAVNNTSIADEFSNNDDWIEIYNSGPTPVNLAGIYISDDFGEPDKWQIPFSDSAGTSVDPYSFIILWADGEPEEGVLHLDFKLSGEGEQIVLYTPDMATLIDSLTFTEQRTDISQGCQPDGADEQFFFDEPTPGTSNISTAYEGFCSEPMVSIPAGFYWGSAIVELNAGTGFDIHYTLDSSEPTIFSPLYSSPISITETTPLRAITFRDGYIPSSIATYTYIIDESVTLPTISLVSSPDNIWGSTGIYDNRYSDWEKPVHIEYFEIDGSMGFLLDGGIKIHAGDSRPQQSFRLYARSEYGEKEIEYHIFEDKEIEKFKRLVLRNGGNDGLQLGKTHIRDRLLCNVYYQTNPANHMSCSKPVHVFLNGEYWGIYNLRERQDRFFIESNCDFDDDIDFLERDAHEPETRHAIEGDWAAFDSLHDFIDTMDMSIDSNYSYVKTRLDIENFAEYWMFEVFAGNRDWLSNNIRFWRPRTEYGKWRWLLWDIEYGLGCFYPDWSHGFPDWDCLGWSTRPGGGWDDTGDNTVIIRNLLENEDFKYYFIIRYADLLNTNLNPSSTLQNIDSLQENLLADIHMQMSKWGGSLTNWNLKIDELRYYVTERPFYLRQHIISKFDLDTTMTLNIDVNPPGAGTIDLNTISPSSFPWEGVYFTYVPLHLTACPAEGYRFVGWEFDSIDASSIGEVLIERGSVWKYLDNGSDMDTVWHSPSFDDSGWLSGPAELGYGDGDEATVVGFGPDPLNKYITTYFRTSFEAINVSEYHSMQLSLLRDDAAVVYLNGFEIVRSSLPDGTIDYTTLATEPATYDDESYFHNFSIDPGLLVSGRNLLAVEIHQHASNSTDISFDLQLTAMKWHEIGDSSSIVVIPTGNFDISAQFELNSSVRISQPMPDDNSILNCYPNPFNSVISIEYDVISSGNVVVSVYSTDGRHIITLSQGAHQAGKHITTWNPIDNTGRLLPTATYLIQVLYDDIVVDNKTITLVK